MTMKTPHKYLIYMDLNNFKDINDQYGHDTGDSVIYYFGCILSDIFYKDIEERIDGDFVSVSEMDGLVCCYGGDEFIVLITCLEKELYGLMQSLHECLLNPVRTSEIDLPEGLSVSVGIIDMESCNSIKLAKRTEDNPIGVADCVMYFAKGLAKKKFIIPQKDNEKVKPGVIRVSQWNDPDAIEKYTILRTEPKPSEEKEEIKKEMFNILDNFYQRHKELFSYLEV